VETPSKTTEITAPVILIFAVPVPLITNGGTRADAGPLLHVRMLPSSKNGSICDAANPDDGVNERPEKKHVPR
jgi:hypothetical protein